MSGFRVLSTNHTSFTVSDLDRTVAFFRDALGFECEYDFERGITELVASGPVPIMATGDQSCTTLMMAARRLSSLAILLLRASCLLHSVPRA